MKHLHVFKVVVSTYGEGNYYNLVEEIVVAGSALRAIEHFPKGSNVLEVQNLHRQVKVDFDSLSDSLESLLAEPAPATTSAPAKPAKPSARIRAIQCHLRRAFKRLAAEIAKRGAA